MEKQGSKSSSWPSQGVQEAAEMFAQVAADGMCRRWCLCPCASPFIHSHNLRRVWLGAQGALGRISLRWKSISAREGRNVILITPEIESFRR